MTISTTLKGTQRWRPLALLVSALVAFGLAATSAHATLWRSDSRSTFLAPHQALEVLRRAFQPISDRPISEGRVVVVRTSAEISALSDGVNISNRAYNPRTGRTWAHGDTDAAWPLGIRGFTDVVTGDVYINAQFAIETTTPHEILHSNVNPDFAQTVGLSLYEGATEQLALEALQISGLTVPDSPEYARERELVAEVMRVAGRQVLARAYFNGGSAMAELVRAVGLQTLTNVKGYAATGRFGAAVAALKAVGAGE